MSLKKECYYKATGAGATASVKRETGANPVRSRHCKQGMQARCHWETGKAAMCEDL